MRNKDQAGQKRKNLEMNEKTAFQQSQEIEKDDKKKMLLHLKIGDNK